MLPKVFFSPDNLHYVTQCFYLVKKQKIENCKKAVKGSHLKEQPTGCLILKVLIQ